MNPTAIIIAASAGGLVTASGWIAAWWQVRATSAVKDRLRDEKDAVGDLAAKLLAAKTTIAKMEAVDVKHSDPNVMQALADALNLLPVADAQRIRAQLYAARRGESAGGDPEHVSGTSGVVAIAEFESDGPG